MQRDNLVENNRRENINPSFMARLPQKDLFDNYSIKFASFKNQEYLQKEANFSDDEKTTTDLHLLRNFYLHFCKERDFRDQKFTAKNKTKFIFPEEALELIKSDLKKLKDAQALINDGLANKKQPSVQINNMTNQVRDDPQPNIIDQLDTTEALQDANNNEAYQSNLETLGPRYLDQTTYEGRQLILERSLNQNNQEQVLSEQAIQADLKKAYEDQLKAKDDEIKAKDKYISRLRKNYNNMASTTNSHFETERRLRISQARTFKKVLQRKLKKKTANSILREAGLQNADPEEQMKYHPLYKLHKVPVNSSKTGTSGKNKQR